MGHSHAAIHERDKNGETTMKRRAFRMKLKPGFEDEYRKRHEEIWPELEALFKSHGVRSHSIYLQEETNRLFAYLEYESEEQMASLTEMPEVQRWWKFMAEIMPANEDNSPESIPLREVYHFQGV